MQKWKCQICGYEFESEDEHPKCPMCFGPCESEDA